MKERMARIICSALAVIAAFVGAVVLAKAGYADLGASLLIVALFVPVVLAIGEQL